jgi:hypothetical protein
VSLLTPVTLDLTSYLTTASLRKQFLILPVNQENTFQNTVVYWEEEVFPFTTYTIRTGGMNIRPGGVWNGHWYTLEWDNEQFPYFHEALPDIDDFNKKGNRRAPNDYKDVPSFTSAQVAEESEKEDERLHSEEGEPKEADQQTQSPPTEATAPPEPTPHEQTTQSEITMSLAATAITTTYGGGRSGPPDAGGGGPSGPGGRGGGPPGGGPPGAPGGGAGGAQPQQANQGDSKPLGALPTIFEGDHTKAESFLCEIKTYFIINHNVPSLRSFIKQIAIALTCIKGPKVNRWMEQQLDWVETLQPVDNRCTSWDTFIQNFQMHFLDSQRAQKACIQLQELKMKWPDIDEYISTFESVVHEAGYNPVDQNTMQLFLQGLTRSISEKVLEDTTANTYDQVKAKAISVMASQRIIVAMYGRMQNNFRCHTRLSVAVLYSFKFYQRRPCTSGQASKLE